MSKPPTRSGRTLRCAVYTRKSSEEGLEQEFNSLHAQREACAAYILSQAHEGWELVHEHYDDGGWTGGDMARPALQQLLADGTRLFSRAQLRRQDVLVADAGRLRFSLLVLSHSCGANSPRKSPSSDLESSRIAISRWVAC